MVNVTFRGGPADGRVETKPDTPYTLMFTGFINKGGLVFAEDAQWVTTTVEYRRTNEVNEFGETIYEFVREF